DTQLLSDHNLTLEGVVANVNGDMTLSAVDDLRVAPGETHTQTQTWNNKSGAFSGGSLYRKTETNSEDGETGLTDSALLVKGNLKVDAGSTEILGTRIQTGSRDENGNFTATTDSGNLTLGAAQASKFHKDSTLDVRLKGTDTLKALKEPHKIVENDDGRAKIKLGSATYLNADNSSTTLSQQGTEVSTFGDITLDATSIGGKTNLAGSTLNSTGIIDLHGTQSLALSSVDATQSEQHKTQEGKGEASFVVQHQAVEVAKAAKNVLDAKEQLSDAKRQLKHYENNLDTQQSQLNQLRADLAAGTPGVTADDVQLLSELVRDLEDDRAWYQTGLALATVNLASANTALLQQSAAAAASTSTWGFNAGLQLDLSASEAKSETFKSTSIGSTLNADTIRLTTGSKNADGSLNTQNTQLDMQGAEISARDISINTGTLNASSREDTERSSSENKQGQISAQVTVYGAPGGASVNGSYQRAESDSQSTTVHNTRIHADTLSISTSGDANLKGATARADEKLTVNVDGNLILDSQQNRSSSKSHEQGMSAGVGLTTGGEANSTNAGVSQGNGRSRTQETVVTSLTSGGTAEITVKGNTHLGGAIIGTLEQVDVCADQNSKACKNEQVFGKDLNQLTFTTGSLTFNDLLNLDTSTSSSFGLSTNLSLGNGQDAQPANPRVGQNNAKTATGDRLSPTSSTISLANSNHNTATKTLSTLGQGNITVGGVELEKDGKLTAAGVTATQKGSLKGLNRDTEKTEKALWDSHQEMKVDASVDHRLFTEEGHKQIKNDAVDTAEFGGDIAAA
ncbi:MAG TPA: hemagglutinin repeat-containing protein, partial [Marinagarivorans sp.]|nr:hemagglutinin repeat-containing protein [Marinagarivorans sp.]